MPSGGMNTNKARKHKHLEGSVIKMSSISCMHFVECVIYFGLHVRVLKNWALVPVVKVRVLERPLTSVWLGCSVEIVEASEAQNRHFTLPLLFILLLFFRLQMPTAVLGVLGASVICRKSVKLSFISGAIIFLNYKFC